MKHTTQITIILVVLFLLSQLVGLAVIDNYVDKEITAQTGQITYEELPYGIERPDAPPLTALVFIMAAILIGTILFLLLIKFKKRFLWKLWFFLAVTLALSIAFSAFIPQIAAFFLGFALAALKILRPSVIIHNFTELFIYGGLAAIFVPLLNIPFAAVLLVLIALYDAYAVWKSKHMITLAKFQSKTNIFAGLLVPYKKAGLKVKAAKGKVKTAVLGGGDMAFPLIFSGVVMSKVGFVNALIIPACAGIALFILLLLGKKGRFYPAMPFITAGCFVGYALLLLL